MSDDPIAIAGALHRALEAGAHGEALRELFHPSAYTIERPNALKPHGARVTLDEMLTASTAGAGLLSEQRYDVHSAFASGNTAVFRLTWTGVVARAAGPFQAGQELVAHIAQFVETDGAVITSIETYDCYEPFAGG